MCGLYTPSNYLLKNKGYEKTFYRELKKILKGKKKLIETRNIYEELSKIPALFITTNYDIHFDKFFLKERIARWQNNKDYQLSSMF